MTTTTRKPVVIGIDRGTESRTALHWGVDEAARRGLTVRLVLASAPPLPTPMTIGFELTEIPAAERRDVLDEAVAYARDRLGADRVSDTFVSGSPASVLIDEATDAELLVVGSRVRGAMRSVVMGSVSCAVAAHARCPVAVVRDADADADADGEGAKPVLVGIDGSAHSDRALRFAFDEADLRGVPLDVSHCWQEIDYIDPGAWIKTATKEISDELSRWLEETVAAVHQKYPHVVVRRHLVVGSAGLELSAQAKDAGLVVVGSRGHGGVAGLLVGSVSQNLLHHAPCTVVVVR